MNTSVTCSIVRLLILPFRLLKNQTPVKFTCYIYHLGYILFNVERDTLFSNKPFGQYYDHAKITYSSLLYEEIYFH